MEYTVSAGAVCMPAHYALVPQEEMIYLDGGITQQDVIQFGVNVLVNGFMVLSGAFFSAGVGMLANAFVGTTLKSGVRIMKDFFSSLNGAQWGALAIVGVMGGFYGVSMLSYYYMALVDPLIKVFQEAYALTQEQLAAQQQAEVVAA